MGQIWGPDRIVTDGLVLSLDAADRNSYPGTGTSWTDISRNGNNGTLTGGPPTFNSGNGGSIVFNGLNDSVNITTLDLRQNFTYLCWAYHSAIDSFSFFGQGTTANNAGLHIWFNSTTNIRFGMYSNDTDAGSLTTSTNTWYHYAFTYNHTTYLKQIYRNGSQLTSNPVQTQSQYSGTGTVRIGATYSSGGAYANGRFANSLIYNKVLSASEILQNYNATKSRFGL